MKYGDKELIKIESCIYKDQNNNFYFKFKINGKQHFFNATKEYRVKNKTQAKETLDEVKYKLRKKGTRDLSVKTFEFYFNEHLKDYNNKNTLAMYKRHWGWIEGYIGHLKPKQITSELIQSILNNEYKKKTDTVKEKLKFILSPVFRKLLKQGIIDLNPLDKITFPSPDTKLKGLAFRLQTPEKDLDKVALELFNNIKQIQDPRAKKNKKLFYLFSIMLLKRRSEILNYKFSDIKDGYLYVKAEYTKHNKDEILLLPEEILDEIEIIKQDNFNPDDKLVNMHFTWASTYFKTVAKKYPLMRLHDLRSLFFIIMVQRGHNMDMLDVCLSHSISGVRGHYLTGTDARKEKIFNDWFNFLRGIS